ncbi:MAG: flagellin, partial [Hydrogenophaga sp.]|nr:flagellin [Hydrogenophaga sp.]
VSKQTSFNGKKVLDGSFTAASFQVGANAGDNITVGSLADTTAGKLSNINYGEAQQTALTGASITGFATAITDGTLTIQVGGGTAVNLGAIGAANSGTERLGQVVEAINRKTADTGVSAFLTETATGTFTVDLLSSKLDAAGAPQTVVFSAGFTDTTTGILEATGLASDTPAAAAARVGIANIDVTTEKGAYIAMKKLDNALDSVNGARAKLGAVQSRFENAVANIQIGVENLSASRGRIMDADFAKETANLSRSQILQQAGTAMVAQANQAPQGVLSLLR